MNLQPNMGRILVKLEAMSDKTASGLYVPISAQDTGSARTGKVVSVGETRLVDGARTAFQVKVDDMVLIDPLGSLKVKVGAEDLYLLRVEDVLGIVTQ